MYSDTVLFVWEKRGGTAFQREVCWELRRDLSSEAMVGRAKYMYHTSRPGITKTLGNDLRGSEERGGKEGERVPIVSNGVDPG